MNNMTTSEAIRELNNSLVCVKAMVFRKTFSIGCVSYATVLCCVPKESYGKANLVTYDNHLQPDSCGTFIRAIGFELMSPVNLMPLSRYERYLEKEGWRFLTTVKSARGKELKKAFETSRLTIKAIKLLRNII